MNTDTFFMEFYLIENHIVLNKVLENFKCGLLLSSGIGKLETFIKLNKLNNYLKANTQRTVNDDVEMKIENEEDLSKEDNLIKESSNFKSYVNDLEDNVNNVYLICVSSTNTNNNNFYGEVLMKLCRNVPDGIIIYFSSLTVMEYFLKRWNEQGLFNHIMNDKLIFVEEQDTSRLLSIVMNYKKAVDSGRGGILFLSNRNKLNAIIEANVNLNGCYSRSSVFIGFTIETKITKKFEMKLEHLYKNCSIDKKEYLNYEALSNFSSKVCEKIKDKNDQKVLVILDDKLQSEKLKEYLSLDLQKMIHLDYDRENNNTDDKLKNIKLFLN